MTYRLECQNSITGIVYDIVTLAGTISHQTSLGGQAGKLTVTLQQDPNGILEISCGSILRFLVDDIGVFYGYIFTMGRDATGIYQITAYDQMRYLKNKETYITSNQTASQVFERVCKDNFQDSQYKVIVPSSFIAPEYNHAGKTLYETIEYGIQQANINETKQYFVKDKFGVLQFTELSQEKTNLIIGDESLLTSYQYEISIDKETYNSVKIYRDNKKTGKREVWIEFDSSTQKQWGKLQTVIQAKEEQNEAQIKELANNYMKLYNRESQTMKLTALGRVELTAGSGFTFQLSDLAINQAMWITSATHTYENDYHTMSLDVYI